jgi:hypothetical protein
MENFNSNYYQVNKRYTKEMAEQRLIEKGYSKFSFKSASFSNGASFYFTLENGQELRVSDHSLTGKRSFNTIEILFIEPKVLQMKRVIDDKPFKLTQEMIATAAERKAKMNL